MILGGLMYIFSVFLDKNKYFNKNIKIKKYTINNLANFINMYLKENSDIEQIYIAGACYGRELSWAKILVKECFYIKNKKFLIYLIKKYGSFKYLPTATAIFNLGHKCYYNKNNKRSDHRKMIFFLNKEKKVKAILIGSSNYSYNTYLKDTHSEADIFLLNYKINSKQEIDTLETNKSFIELLKNKIQENDIKFNDNFILSESINSNNFLDDIFNELNITINDIVEYNEENNS